MRKSDGPSYLRLVTAQQEPDKGATQSFKGKGGQLSFPYPESTTVLFVFVDSISPIEFENIVQNYLPRWVIDVRAVPRLDTIAVSRTSAFHLFDRAKVHYVDLFGRLGIKSYRSVESNPAFWSNSVSELISQSDRKGPYLFLFDDEHLMKIADQVLPQVIQPLIGKAARFAHIRHAN